MALSRLPSLGLLPVAEVQEHKRISLDNGSSEDGHSPAVGKSRGDRGGEELVLWDGAAQSQALLCLAY